MKRDLFYPLGDVAPPIGIAAGFAALVIAAVVGLILLVRKFIKTKTKK